MISHSSYMGRDIFIPFLLFDFVQVSSSNKQKLPYIWMYALQFYCFLKLKRFWFWILFHYLLLLYSYFILSCWKKKDVDFESEAKKQVRGSTSTKRSRAAEVHNLSERVCTFISLSSSHLLYSFLSQNIKSFHLAFAHRGVVIGLMKRWELCKNLYLDVIR